MKKYSHQIAALAFAALALCGCVKEGWVTGKAIRFGAGSQAEALTKTAYGDITTDSGGKRTHQMVDWQEGDVIRIACAQASTVETGTSTSADYKTSAGEKSGTESRATLSLASNNDKGLRWGSTEVAHVFYAVYPSPQVKSGTSLTVAGAFTGIVPESQSVASVSGTSPSFVAAPDMKNQYMVAKRTVAAGTQEISEEEVFLNFTPVTTAIEFEIKNGMDDALGISSIELISTASYLSGTFTASLDALNENGLYPSGYPVFNAGADKKKNAKLDFGTSGRTLAVGDILTLTVFLLPESNLSDLTFRINKLDGTYIQTALKTDASTWIGFDRCKKYFIHGLLVQDGAKWTLCFDPDVAPWDDVDEEAALNDPEASGNPSLSPWEEGEGGSLPLTKPAEYAFSIPSGAETQTFSDPTTTGWNEKEITVTSTKTFDGETDDNHGWTVQSYKVGSGSPVTVTGNTFTVDGLTVAKDGKKLKVTDGRTAIDKGSSAYWTGSNGNWSPEAKSTTTDLSKYDFEADASRSTMRTANCYVIRHAGTYRIPLVYGNAIDEVAVTGGKNSAAYAGVSGGLNPFLDYNNNKIIDPFIENNTTDGEPIRTSGNPSTRNAYLKVNDAVVVWQDEGTVVSDVTVGGSAAQGSNSTSSYKYIQFKVGVGEGHDIRQCNAVIAARDASEKIMWSWHIWITNDPALLSGSIPVTNATSKTYNFFPLPCLGWIEPPYYEVKDDVVVTLQQEESDETMTVTIKRPTYHYPGNGTYYQYGRKDPMPRKDALVGGSESTMTRTDVAGTTVATSGVYVGTSIWHPQTFYYSSNGSFGNWCRTKYNNLWTGMYNTSGTSVDNNASTMIKTVYDPCPVGYKVPASKAFTAFASLPSTPMTELKGFTFQAGGRTIFFPACGMRTYKETNFGISGGVTYNAGDVARLGLNAYYVTAISSDTNSDSGDNAYKVFTLGFNGSSITPENKNVRANGMSVRPVKE